MECVICNEDLLLVVCKEDILKKAYITTIPCGHVFHLNCLETWININKNCPICRKKYAAKHIQLLYLPLRLDEDFDNMDTDLSTVEAQSIKENPRRQWLSLGLLMYSIALVVFLIGVISLVLSWSLCKHLD